MLLPNPFNANDYEPNQAGGAICLPLADYKVEITGAEPRVVKDNTAAGFLELTLTVTDGEAKGLTQKDRINLWNPSEVAKRIANQTFAAYLFAINRPFVQDTNQIIGGRCICTIGPQDDNPKYSEVKLVKCMDGSLPTRQAQSSGQAPAQTPPQAPPTPPQTPPTPPPPVTTTPATPPGFPPATTFNPASPVNTTATYTNSAPSAPPWGNSQAAPGSPTGTPPWARGQ